MDGWMDERMYGQMDIWTDIRMDGWTDEWMDRWTDRERKTQSKCPNTLSGTDRQID